MALPVVRPQAGLAATAQRCGAHELQGEHVGHLIAGDNPRDEVGQVPGDALGGDLLDQQRVDRLVRCEQRQGSGTSHQTPACVEGPAVMMRERGEEQRGIGDASGDDDVRPALQRLDDGSGSEVGVGEPQGGGLREVVWEELGTGPQVVAHDRGHREAGTARSPSRPTLSTAQPARGRGITGGERHARSVDRG
jgi:hypothetical protein